MAELASFTLKKRNPDVLTCIANLSNDEVFTPPEFAKQMLDTIEKAWSDASDGASIWSDSKVTFLDPCTKSGVFLREIVERLTHGLQNEIPDLQTRVDHILTKQVFGIGITQLTSLLARRSVYCSKFANGEHSVASSFDNADGNIWFESIKHTWIGGTQTVETADEHGNPIQRKINGRCKYCGASQSSLERSIESETHAYSFIHTDDVKKFVSEIYGEKMQFDVIIGNPPYQLNDGGAGASARPIYNLFVEQAKKLEPRLLTFVVPARWLAGGKGLNEFRSEMLGDERIQYLTDYINSKECFPGVSVGGGICYFLWNREYQGACSYTNVLNGSKVTLDRALNAYPIFVRYNNAISVIEKIDPQEKSSMSNLVDSRNPFGISSNYRGQKSKFDGALALRASDGTTFIEKEVVTAGVEKINKYKVIMGKVISEHGGEPDKNGQMKIISSISVLGPSEVCTDSYLCVGTFSKKSEAQNLMNYFKTKFVRFLMMQAISSINLSKDKFYFVPVQDFAIDWNDAALYEKYLLSEFEIDFIESIIRPMEIDNE